MLLNQFVEFLLNVELGLPILTPSPPFTVAISFMFSSIVLVFIFVISFIVVFFLFAGVYRADISVYASRLEDGSKRLQKNLEKFGPIFQESMKGECNLLLRPVDASGDILPVSSSSDLLSGPEAVARLAAYKLSLLKGDWWEDPEDGFFVMEFMREERFSEANAGMFASRVTEFIRGVEGVFGGPGGTGICI